MPSIHVCVCVRSHLCINLYIFAIYEDIVTKLQLMFIAMKTYCKKIWLHFFFKKWPS